MGALQLVLFRCRRDWFATRHLIVSPFPLAFDFDTELWRRVTESGINPWQRTFADFDDYWTTIRGGPSTRRGLATMSDQDRATLQTRMRKRLPADAAGRITCSANANAVKGQVAS